MKYKQLYPKSKRPIESSMSTNLQRKRCQLCDALLKCQRYLLLGKSIQDSIIINNHKTITYAECCRKYLKKTDAFNKLHIICLKCCDELRHLHSLHLDAEELSKKLNRNILKTKRLNRTRQSHTKHEKNIEVKEESFPAEVVSAPFLSNSSYIPNNLQSYDTTKHMQMSHIPSVHSAFVPPQTFSNEHSNYFYHQNMHASHSVPFAQFLIESPMLTNFPRQQQENDSNNNQQLDDERSLSPCANDDDGVSKNSRLTRRQYEFLTKLPDQNSLNAFIETSSTESNSRWTWRRTSANSRGYKIYYVCNYSMRRHYHPCPAAMYALFNPEGTISIYAHGQHQHIPKSRLPLTITDESKDEIFKCLQAGMSATDIREHLIRLQLPFGDAKKLNNFIKYHKELLRFGAVTNVRINGSAYRQPQFWAIRRPSPVSTNAVMQQDSYRE